MLALTMAIVGSAEVSAHRRDEYLQAARLAIDPARVQIVSGAAAMLIARHRELMGDPRRVKQILCDSATDLGRERYFQGHGLLDVLRALQAV